MTASALVLGGEWFVVVVGVGRTSGSGLRLRGCGAVRRGCRVIGPRVSVFVIDDSSTGDRRRAISFSRKASGDAALERDET
jgi:hypothetical protein